MLAKGGHEDEAEALLGTAAAGGDEFAESNLQKLRESRENRIRYAGDASKSLFQVIEQKRLLPLTQAAPFLLGGETVQAERASLTA